MLTGELPYYPKDSSVNSDHRMAIYAHFHLPPRPFAEVLGDRMTPLHQVLEPIVMKALEKNPKHRYRDVRVLLRDLEKAGIQMDTMNNQPDSIPENTRLTPSNGAITDGNMGLADTGSISPLDDDDITQFLAKIRGGQGGGAHEAPGLPRARDRFEKPSRSNSSPRHADLSADETQALSITDRPDEQTQNLERNLSTVWMRRSIEPPQSVAENSEEDVAEEPTERGLRNLFGLLGNTGRSTKTLLPGGKPFLPMSFLMGKPSKPQPWRKVEYLLPGLSRVPETGINGGVYSSRHRHLGQVYASSEVFPEVRRGAESLENFSELGTFFEDNDDRGNKVKPRTRGAPGVWGFLGRAHYDPQGLLWKKATKQVGFAATGVIASLGAYTARPGMHLVQQVLSLF